jgi:hypothetical protein
MADGSPPPDAPDPVNRVREGTRDIWSGRYERMGSILRLRRVSPL